MKTPDEHNEYLNPCNPNNECREHRHTVTIEQRGLGDVDQEIAILKDALVLLKQQVESWKTEYHKMQVIATDRLSIILNAQAILKDFHCVLNDEGVTLPPEIEKWIYAD